MHGVCGPGMAGLRATRASVPARLMPSMCWKSTTIAADGRSECPGALRSEPPSRASILTSHSTQVWSSDARIPLMTITRWASGLWPRSFRSKRALILL